MKKSNIEGNVGGISLNRDAVMNHVAELQALNNNLLLCGSLALMHAKVLDARKVSDIDFVLNKRDFKREEMSKLVLSIREDRYFNKHKNLEDKYASYSGYTSIGGVSNWIKVNFLVFEDEVKLHKEIVNGVACQDQKTILEFKYKYNRKKDKKDLDNIASKEIESILAE